jgi:hypothetical protein
MKYSYHFKAYVYEFQHPLCTMPRCQDPIFQIVINIRIIIKHMYVFYFM